MRIDSLPYGGLLALVSNVQDAIVLLDADGKLLFESPSAIRLRDPDDDVPLGLDRIHPDERDSVVESFRRTIAVPGAVSRGTYRFRRSSGGWQHLEALAKNLLDDPRIGGVLITFRDVSDRIDALDQARRSAGEQDLFLSRMSHELRTPLHAILGWAQLLRSHGDDDVAEAADQVEASGQHLLRIVEEAIDLAAIREGRLQIDSTTFSVDDLIGEAVGMIAPLAAERDIRIAREETDLPRLVVADRTRLRQILLNVLGNAVKFSRFAGKVDIVVRERGERTRIAVRDSGPGISPELIGDIFRRYARLQAEQLGVEGSGLGLAISNQLAHLMGGVMGVESQPGAGSEFWVEVPVGDARPSVTLRHLKLVGSEAVT